MIRRLKEEAASVSTDDKGTVFNQDVLSVIELGFMIDNAEAIVLSALERRESRGAQYRTDIRSATTTSGSSTSTSAATAPSRTCRTPR